MLGVAAACDAQCNVNVLPSGFSKISLYLEWIREEMAKDSASGDSEGNSDRDINQDSGSTDSEGNSERDTSQDSESTDSE